MKSELAEALRVERLRREAAMSPLERLRLAQRVGDESVAAFASALGLTLREARRELARRRQTGRRPSAAARP